MIHACGVLQQHECAIGVYYDYARCIARQAILGFTIHQLCFLVFSLNIFNFNFMTYIHILTHYIRITADAKSLSSSSLDNIQLHKYYGAYSVSDVKRSK